MKRTPSSKPSWFLDTRTLNKWRDVQGILVFTGQQCQIVVCSCTEPQFVWLARPVRIIEEDGVIVGTFCANEHIRSEQKKARLPISPYDWKCGAYMRGLKAFVINVEPTALQIFDTMPNTRYLNFDERKALAAKMAEVTQEKQKRVS